MAAKTASLLGHATFLHFAGSLRGWSPRPQIGSGAAEAVP